ncbi:molybdenum ABC transporter ATP-binding protein [Candidatus Magnetaquicoccus inordinatus]|uniref:molybdenum ABC transporter ATP-binding protein n=1 Tax=Candidatus Magnetaquicoccus inordinatus TaxID=2496818 RepID=UPI00102B839B|nr:molybdenum ABC transporter ATP-binding protein [Candidatus Magnetaquicoccus inordinatus]
MGVAEEGIRLLCRQPLAEFLLDVAVTLPGRGCTAVFGPSGAGKSTLLRFIAGLERVEAGQLWVNGQCWQDAQTGRWVPPHQRAVGYVFQDGRLFAHLNVGENLRYGMRRVASAPHRVAWEQILDLLGIESLLSRAISTLSGGERQRVAIARALAVSPEILLLDEPLAAVDLLRKQEILPYLERLHREMQIPMLFVSHAPDEVARLADHLLLLQRGQVVGQGALTETLAQLQSPLALAEEKGVVWQMVVAERAEQWHLCRMQGEGVSLWSRDGGVAVGESVRVRILARDVGLSLQRQEHTSIQNQLLGRVSAIADDSHPGLVLLQLRIGALPLVARLTRRSLVQLGLQVDAQVWAQVKAVALL